MRFSLLIGFLTILVACDKSDPERFYPLTQEEKDLLPSGYSPGDTLYFLYSDSTKSDTLPFVMEEFKNYFTSTGIPDGMTIFDEIAETGFLCTKDGRRFVISIGNLEDLEYSSTARFYVSFDKKGYYWSYLPRAKGNSTDTINFELTKRWGSRYTDSIRLSYSTYEGVLRLQDFTEGYKLERLP